MPLINFIVVIALIGFILWLVLTYIPMPEAIKRILIIGVCIILVLWLLQVLGIFSGLETIRIGPAPQ